jgi:putative flippase GtrA
MRDEGAAGLQERATAPITPPQTFADPEPAPPPALGLHTRVRHGLKRPHNWWQLIRFGLTGIAGYLVNVGSFTVLSPGIGIDYRVGATLSFIIGMTFSFFANRHFTFRGCEGRAHQHAWRFVVVSLVAYAAYLALLLALYKATPLGETPAQALAAALVAPVSFLGNKLWSFRP